MIGSSENRISYDGNGIATEFAYTFKILEKSDLFVLHVAIDGTETLLTKDYYVDMEKSVVLYPGYAPGAEIPEAERPPILPVGERLVLYRQVPITQESALDKHWPFSVIEDGLDKLTIICQQIWDRLGRSFYVSESTSTNFNPKVPIEPGKTFRVKDDGTGFEVTEDPGKVIDGATALLEQTTEQANIAVVNSTNAQNAADRAEYLVDGNFPYVTPEMFGAVGDGVIDDTDAIQQACQHQVVLFSNKTYILNDIVDTTNCRKMLGTNTTISTTKSENTSFFKFRTSETIEVAGFKFDLQRGSCYNVLLFADNKNVCVHDVEICNIFTNTGPNIEYDAVGIFAIRPHNCDIYNVNIHDIKSLADNIIGNSKGNTTGIFVQRFTGQCSIHDSFFEEIHSVDSSGTPVFEDSNAIYVTELNAPGSNCSIYGCSGKDVGKRFIKTQCTCLVTVDNCSYINTMGDFLLAIGIQSTESPEQTTPGLGIISNCFLKNTFKSSSPTLMISTSERVNVINCVINSGYGFAFGGTGYFSINNCTVEGYGLALNITNEFLAKGVYFKGKTLFYGSAYSEKPTITFNDCRFTRISQYDGLSYPNYVQNGAYVHFNNCIIKDINIYVSGELSLTNCIWYVTLKVPYITFYQSASIERGDICRIKNVTIEDISGVESDYALVNLQNIIAYIEELKFPTPTSANVLAGFSNIELHIGAGNDITKWVFNTNVTLAEVYPEWYDNLPNNKNNYSVGILALNKQDGKLYRLDLVSNVKTWVAVN